MIRSLVQNAYQAVRDALATGAVSFGGTLTALSNVILAGAVTFTGSGVATIADFVTVAGNPENGAEGSGNDGSGGSGGSGGAAKH